jgi:hypothetical protein
MSSPEETTKTPTKKPRQGVPLERILIALSVVGIVLLLFYGLRVLTERVKLDTTPVTGAWQAQHQAWRIDLKPDKTVVGSNGPSGKYKVDYFGTLWITLDNGKVFKATLNPEMPNRFDLIQMDTEGVTVFERVNPPKPNLPQAPK